MRISDWSSDVCSSDLSLQPQQRSADEQTELYNVDRVSKSEGLDGLPADYSKLPPQVPELGPDRKSVVSGKSVSVRVDLGGRRNIKKKNKKCTIHRDRKRIQDSIET